MALECITPADETKAAQYQDVVQFTSWIVPHIFMSSGLKFKNVFSQNFRPLACSCFNHKLNIP